MPSEAAAAQVYIGGNRRRNCLPRRATVIWKPHPFRLPGFPARFYARLGSWTVRGGDSARSSCSN